MHALSFKIARFAFADEEQKVTPEFVTLVELSERKSIAEAVASRYGFENLVLDDWHSVAQQPGIDLFVNAGPNDAHGAPSILAAQSGKHLFSEKPLASTADEAHAIWRAVEEAGVRHQCGFIHRFIPSLRLVRDMIKAGELGEILHFRSQFLLDMQEPDRSLTWRFSTGAAGGGATGDLGSHHIDVARFTVGEVVEICASTRTWSKDSTGRIVDVNDDSFSAVAHLETGALATFEASRITPGHALTGRIEIDGTQGSVTFSMERLNELVFTEPHRGPRTIFVTAPAHIPTLISSSWHPGSASDQLARLLRLPGASHTQGGPAQRASRARRGHLRGWLSRRGDCRRNAAFCRLALVRAGPFQGLAAKGVQAPMLRRCIVGAGRAGRLHRATSPDMPAPGWLPVSPPSSARPAQWSRHWILHTRSLPRRAR